MGDNNKTFLEFGTTAAQFLCEGMLIADSSGEFFTVAFVDDCYAWSGLLEDMGIYHIFARDEKKHMQKIEARYNQMIPTFEAITSEEFAALLGN